MKTIREANTLASPLLRLAVRWLCLGAALCLVSLLHAAEPAKKPFDVPAGAAEGALKKFSEQSGVHVVFPVDGVSGIRTNAVQGEFVASDALTRMLDGTNLVAVRDPKSGAFAVRRAAPVEPESAPKSPRSDNGLLLLEKVEVNASKVGGLNNQTIFRTDEQAALAYDVISRVDIERMGVTSIEELFRLIPQTTDYGSVSLQGAPINAASAGGATYQNSEVKLRGFSSLQTTILINGRRLQRGNLSAGPDLNRIPTASIDRIEILASSASAIYGGGAIGGAINIILRKDYTGRDLTVGAGTSTAGGAERYQATYFEGRSLNQGKTQFSFTFDYQHSAPLYNGDRDYLKEALARYPANTTALVGGRSVFEQYMLQAYAGMPGTILLNAATGTLPIPGVTGARFAAIPAGQDGTALTPASFVAGAGKANLGERYQRSMIYRPEDRYSFTSQLEHEIIPTQLSLYAEVGVSYFRSSYSFPQFLAALPLTATDSLNPFRTGVTPGFVGVPITVYYDPVDLPDPTLFQERQGARALLGFKGRLFDRWEWSLDGTGEYGRSHSTGRNPNQNMTNFVNSTAVGTLTQVQRRALYNPLADHTIAPRGAVMAEYLEYNRQYTYYNKLSQVNLRVVGDVFQLPAGPVQISPGAEVIWSQYETHATVGVSPAILAAIPTGVIGPSQSVARQSRRTQSVFFESVFPLIGNKWRPLPLESVDLNLGARWEGTDDSTDGTSPVAALRFGVTKDIALRVSYAEGFFPPDQSQYESPRVSPLAITPFTDPARGNASYNYAHEEISGGNPALKPEESKAWNYGIIFTPRAIKGLNLTLDFWQIEKINAILSPAGPSVILASPASYPGRVIRSAPTASDLANGWLGAVTSIDYRPINVGFTQTEGIDIKARYTRNFEGVGTFTSVTSSTWTGSFRDQILVTNPIVERVNSSGNPLKWRGNTSLFLESGRWTSGVTATFINHYQGASNLPSPAFPTGNGLDGKFIPSATLWDLQVSYQVPATRGVGTYWQSWFNDTKWTLGVRNVLDKVPAFRTDIYSYYSRYEDPRQRFVTIQVKKSF